MLNSKCRRLPSAAVFLSREAVDCRQFLLPAFREAFDCRQRPFFCSGKLSTAINSVSQHSEKLSTAVSGRFFVAGSFRLPSIPSPSIQRSFRLPSAAISKSREVVDCNQRPFPPEGERKESGAIRAVAFGAVLLALFRAHRYWSYALKCTIRTISYVSV